MKGKVKVAVIQGYHSDKYGWEDESCYYGPDRRDNARKNIVEYRLSAPKSKYRIVYRWEEERDETID